MAEPKKSVIVIKKVKKGHGGHHGGSWKVAYADFVTAMMAFFMVMWILGMDSETRKAIEGYFTNPVGMEQGYSSGVSPIANGSSPMVVKTPNPLRLITRSFEEQKFRELATRYGPLGILWVDGKVERLLGAALSGVAQISPTWEGRAVYVGLAEAPRAMADMLAGRTTGKTLIRL